MNNFSHIIDYMVISNGGLDDIKNTIQYDVFTNGPHCKLILLSFLQNERLSFVNVNNGHEKFDNTISIAKCYDFT